MTFPNTGAGNGSVSRACLRGGKSALSAQVVMLYSRSERTRLSQFSASRYRVGLFSGV